MGFDRFLLLVFSRDLDRDLDCGCFSGFGMVSDEL